MSISIDEDLFDSRTTPYPKSKLVNLIKHHVYHTSNTMMIGLKLKDRCKTTQVHALNNPSESNTKVKSNPLLTINSILSNTCEEQQVKFPNLGDTSEILCDGFPRPDLFEPPIEFYLKNVDFVVTIAELYRRIESSCESNKCMMFVEQYALLCNLGDSKLLRRCLQSARQHAVDPISKVVVSAWLRYERREDELVGVSGFDCVGRVLECPKAALVDGYDPNLAFDHCKCNGMCDDMLNFHCTSNGECSTSEEDDNVCFCIENVDIYCVRDRIANLSTPLRVMLYGKFAESRKDKIDFSHIGISAEGMSAVELFSRTRRFGCSSPKVVLEVLSFANRFCCEEMKSGCDVYLASFVCSLEDALVLIDYGIEEGANLLLASCLQVLLRELPSALNNPKVMGIFCTSEARERLSVVGNASFLLYYFLSQVAVEEKTTSNVILMLLQNLRECAVERWQKALALHQLGCVSLERNEYKDAEWYFDAAAENGHVYSLAGVARIKYKQGQRFSSFEILNRLISDYGGIGWMYQERSLYSVGRKKILDLNEASKLDPTLSFPYKYRAVALAEENEVEDAILEINKIIRFKLSPDCLELRAWFFMALKDYDAALRDIRALLTLEPDYKLFHRKMRGDHLVDLLNELVQQWSPADCWLQLYDRWSSIDDIGSLAVIHQMLLNDPGKSLLLFRQSLLLLRLNCQKAAMRSLRLARNHSSSEYERLVYEGWILYDTGHREEALSKAEKSISIQRSFEAFFLKAYTLADTTLDPDTSSYVIQLLKDALGCPSDGLRKGQALNNLGSIYADCGKLDLAADCYINALDIKHTRAHQGLARVYYLKNEKKAAFEEMTKLINKAPNNASAYEKRSEYGERDMANNDLSTATQLDPLRTYPYRYRAAVLMDDQRESEAVDELNKAISFKPDLQMLHLRSAFHESMGDVVTALIDCEAALCLDPNHKDTLDLYSRTRGEANHLQK